MKELFNKGKTTAQIVRETLEDDDGIPDCMCFQDEITKWFLEKDVKEYMKQIFDDLKKVKEIIKEELGEYAGHYGSKEDVLNILKKYLGDE